MKMLEAVTRSACPNMHYNHDEVIDGFVMERDLLLFIICWLPDCHVVLLSWCNEVFFARHRSISSLTVMRKKH